MCDLFEGERSAFLSGNMSAGITKLPTLEERENLMEDVSPHRSGFTPRPLQQLAIQKRPREMIDIECQHFLRSSTDTFTHQHPSVPFQLWLEAGKYDAPFPERPDPSYNSNIWRNFRRHYGFQTSADGRKMSDVIAAMYPLNIPTASKVGDNTFERYIRDTALFRDKKKRAVAIKQTRADLEEFKKLKNRTEARHPPLDKSGNILPPENYKHYAHRFVPVDSPPPTPPPPGQKTDMFGRRYVPRSQPHLWKLSYKLNHPEYVKLQEEIAKRRKLIEERQKRKRILPSPVSFDGLHIDQ
ncbi:testis-expressed protein 52-like [Babylonia areolata]|uniref:testis-expressed protein 52-like n=1 Tax=Babylonia areolata TaxID=304850 RepID=UPI003FD1BBAA